MEDKLEVLKTLIAEFFSEEFYHVSIANVRKAIRENVHYKHDWDDIVRMILFRNIPNGEALNILFDDGHLILHENTEEGAYRWLMLMLVNVSRGYNEPIIGEREFLDPNLGLEIKPIT